METMAKLAFPGVTLLLGMAGGLLTGKAIPTWYNKLKKPALNPPNWIFGPVWTVLYLMIGYSGYLIWNQNKEFSENHKIAWFVYFLQLGLNYLWTPVFFGIKKLLLALFIISGLTISIFLNIYLFYEITPTAGLLLIPYLLWVSFASYLNYSIWKLNSRSCKNEN
jgi:benzodiazapine receptor